MKKRKQRKLVKKATEHLEQQARMMAFVRAIYDYPQPHQTAEELIARRKKSLRAIIKEALPDPVTRKRVLDIYKQNPLLRRMLK